LFLASKIEEVCPLRVRTLADMTNGCCTFDDILKCERVILETLQWRLLPMTPNAWMKLYMQICTYDQQEEAATHQSSFLCQHYSGEHFANAMRLLDLAVLDVGSLAFSYSVLAAASFALTHGVSLALAVSKLHWIEDGVSKCVDWMSAFNIALCEDDTSKSANIENNVGKYDTYRLRIPKAVSSIPYEDRHNIQTHSTDLSVLYRAKEILKARISSPPPNPSQNPVLNVGDAPLEAQVEQSDVGQDLN